jgi:predicted DNA-binding protein
MTSVSLELQGAIIKRLKAFAPLSAIVGDRIYDQPPGTVTFPYVSLGPDDAVSDDAECLTSFEVTIQVDAWSKNAGRVELKQVSEAVRAALHDHDLALEANALLSIRHRQTRHLPDPGGETNHAAIEFVALVEQP